jgi:hypothetical protein
MTPTGEHGGAAGHDDVGVQVLADVHVALHDGLEGAVVDAAGLLANETGLEQHLSTPDRWWMMGLEWVGFYIIRHYIIGFYIIGYYIIGYYIIGYYIIGYYIIGYYIISRRT